MDELETLKQKAILLLIKQVELLEQQEDCGSLETITKLLEIVKVTHAAQISKPFADFLVK